MIYEPSTDDELTPGERPTRRTVVKASLAGAAAVGLTAGLTAASLNSANAAAVAPVGGRRTLTPQCTDGDDTHPLMEGPYFEAGSPEQTNLVINGVSGVLLGLTGVVYDEQCKPVAHALLDFWQADKEGNYDNSGYTLRGHQYTNDQGQYTLSTIIPRYYTDAQTGTRCPHIHVKAQAPNAELLTTQLFFTDDVQAYGMDMASLNAQDSIIDRACNITTTMKGSDYTGTFDFVIKTA